MSTNPWRGRRRHVPDRTSVAAPSTVEKQNVTPSTMLPIRRPGYGRLGKPVLIDSNFFKLTIPDNLRGYLYTVTITRRRTDHRGRPLEKDVTASLAAESNRNTLECLRNKFKLFKYSPAYDGRSHLFSVEDRTRHIGGDEPYEIEVNDDGFDNKHAMQSDRLIKIYVYITYVKSINFADLRSGRIGNVEGSQLLQSLDIALAAAPLSNPQYAQVGRSFYNDIRASPLTSNDVVASAWSGFYQSVRQTSAGLFVNVDFTCTGFWNGGGRPFMDVIAEFSPQVGRRGWTKSRDFDSILRKLTNAFNGLTVKATHNQISYSVYGFSKFGASDMTFTMGSRRVTIAEYFASQYNYILQHPDWPCVRVQKKKEIYVPIELLIVKTKQPYKGNIVGEAHVKMVQYATAEPQVVRTTVQQNIRSIDHAQNETCKSFGIGVSDQLIRCSGRVLPSPRLQYEKDRDPRKWVSVRNGSWSAEVDNRPLRFLKPAKIQEWAILNTTKLGKRDVQEFAEDLHNAMRTAGITGLGRPHLRACDEDRVSGMIHSICEEHRQPNSLVHRMSLIVVIKERQDTRCYGAIKVSGDIISGVVTQACLQRNCSSRARNKKLYLSNLVLKINTKLGGVNWSTVPFAIANRGSDPEFTKYPFIVLGADVSHPSGGGPSVAALVGSLDGVVFQFAAAIRNQKGKQEIISDMGNMFTNVYRQWFLRNNKKFHTQSIIMFRDGVSEGQFADVMEQEISGIREACSMINANFKPKITYILITKRHHVRFFPADRRTGDRKGNILPGTVVDTDVTSNDFYDFFLNSHASVRGTNKPSKYTVLLDENNVPPDLLQTFIYRHTHSYCRHTGSVSMVHAAYYAHHLASRGRLYLTKASEDERRRGGGNRGRGGPRRQERPHGNASNDREVEKAPAIHGALRNRLFFV